MAFKCAGCLPSAGIADVLQPLAVTFELIFRAGGTDDREGDALPLKCGGND